MRSKFSGKVIIITGSSMGIGKSLAILLGSYNAKLVINGRNPERLQATEKEIKDKGYDVLSFAGDVTNESDCKKLVDATLKQFGKIDVLVNNAGISMRGTIEQVLPAVTESIFNVNTIAPINLSQLVIPHVRQTNGSIVFISSLAGLRGLPIIGLYSAAKMALTGIAEALRVELKSDNIHIGLVHVGYTEIEAGKTTIGADGNPISLNERKGFLSSTTEHVAKKIATNIAARKKRTVIGFTGKFYSFLIRYFPGVIEVMINRSHEKMKKMYR